MVLVVTMQAGLLAPWLGAGRGAGDGIWLQAAFGAAYALAACLLLVRWARRGRARASWWLLWPLAYLLLATLSLTWSELPALTARRVLALAGTLVFAVWVVETMTPARMLRNAALGLATIALLSVAMLAATPRIAVHAEGTHVGSWRGALLHKNLLGREMALATTLALGIALAGPRGQRPAWLGLALVTAVLVVGARSATGLAVLAAGAATVLFVSLPAVGARERMGRRVVLGAALVAVVAAVAAFAAPALEALGRDATLTGRDRIWQVTLAVLGERAWLGHGFGAFWEGTGGAAVSRELGYRVGHAHNGWLQALASLGVPGVALLATLWLALVHHAWRAPGLAGVRAPLMGFAVHVGLLSLTDAVMSGPNSLSLTVALTAVLMAGARDRGGP